VPTSDALEVRARVSGQQNVADAATGSQDGVTYRYTYRYTYVSGTDAKVNFADKCSR